MSDILKIFVSLSLSGTLLIIILFLCKPLWKEKTSKRWQYYIWLIVIVRLLLPFTPETSLVGSMFESLGQTIVSQTNDTPAPMQNDNTIPPNKGEGLAKPPVAASNEPDTISASFSLATVLATVGRNLLLVWLFVAVVLLIQKITIYQGFVKYIKAGRSEVPDTVLLDRLAEIGAQIGVKRPVELYTNSLISSPLLIGFFRPCIVLPTADLSANDFYYTILHELLHYRRRDMFYKWLVQLTICLHWFNPFVYWMGQEIGRACELACDEAVIKRLNPSRQREYGDTLLNAFGSGGSYRDSIASVTLNESKELLKERLSSIMKFAIPSKFMKFTTAFLTLILCLGAMFTGAYAIAPSSVSGHVGQSPTISFDPQTEVIKISSNRQQNIAKSGSFDAKESQLLILTIQSDITGGTADFFLFSPTGKEQRITIGGSDKTETVTLTAGRWAYNCSGFFESGTVTVTGQLSAKENATISNQTASSENTKIAETNTILNQNGNWNFFDYTYLDGYMIGIGSRAQDNLKNYSQTIQLAVDDKEYTVAFYEQAKMYAKDDKFIKALRVAVADVISQGWRADQSRGSFLIVNQVIADKTADELYEYFCEQGDPHCFAVINASCK